MVRLRLKIVGVLVPALLLLLLCGIVAAEFPELLSLTDDATNDFTVCNANGMVLPAVAHSSRGVRVADVDSNSPECPLLFSRVKLLERASLLNQEPVLRT
jgi:hypothetical protein